MTEIRNFGKKSKKNKEQIARKKKRKTELRLVIKNRMSKLEENKSILKAYEGEIDQKETQKRQEKIYKKGSNIYVKQLKLMNELGILFFHPKHAPLFSELAQLTGRYTFESEKDVRISTSLSYLGLFGIHTAKYFNLGLKYPIGYNGTKSFIVRDQYRQYSLNPSKNSTSTTIRFAITMLSENIQCIWNFIVSKSQKTTDIFEETGSELIEGSEKLSENNLILSKEADDYFFHENSRSTFGKVPNDDMNKTQFITLDSSLSLIDTTEDDKFTIEQPKMIETLMNIVEFIIK